MASQNYHHVTSAERKGGSCPVPHVAFELPLRHDASMSAAGMSPASSCPPSLVIEEQWSDVIRLSLTDACMQDLTRSRVTLSRDFAEQAMELFVGHFGRKSNNHAPLRGTARHGPWLELRQEQVNNHKCLSVAPLIALIALIALIVDGEGMRECKT